MLKAVCSDSHRILLAGDFNYPGIDWSTLSSPMTPDHPTNVFLDTLRDCFLYRHITHPTRFRLGIAPSTLDIVLTSEEGMVSGIEYLPGLSSSDHVVLRFNAVCYTIPLSSQLEPKPAYNKADFNKLRREVGQLDWDSLRYMSLQDAYSSLMTMISDLVDEFVPKSKPGKKKNLYLNREALSLQRRKRTLWNRYVRTKSLVDHANFAACSNALRKLTRKLRSDLEAKIASQVKVNPKSFWKYANTRLKTKSSIDVLIDEDGEDKFCPKDKAEVLNKFFSAVYSLKRTYPLCLSPPAVFWLGREWRM